MLIFTIPGWYRSKKFPEASIFIFEQMQALAEAGDKVVVLNAQPVSFKSKETPDTHVEYEDDHGVLTYSTEFRSLFPSKLRLQHLIVFRRAVRRLYEQAMKDHGKPDVLYAHFSFPAGAIAVDLMKDYGVPLVTEEHYSGLMKERIDRSLRYCLNKTVSGSKSFIAVSTGLKQAIEIELGKQTEIKVVSNMINEVFQFKAPVDHAGFVFFACGSLTPRKGYVELIRAFAKEFKGEKNIILRIGGSGEQRNKLEALIAELGIASQVKLIGQLSREETLVEYAGCDCFVLPSKAETFGLVYREALAVGRPVISTRHGGFDNSNWYEEYGELIPIDDEQALRNAMRKVIQNYPKYDLQKISELCLKDCAKSVVAKRIHDELETSIKS